MFLYTDPQIHGTDRVLHRIEVTFNAFSVYEGKLNVSKPEQRSTFASDLAATFIAVLEICLRISGFFIGLLSTTWNSGKPGELQVLRVQMQRSLSEYLLRL